MTVKIRRLEPREKNAGDFESPMLVHDGTDQFSRYVIGTRPKRIGSGADGFICSDWLVKHFKEFNIGTMPQNIVVHVSREWVNGCVPYFLIDTNYGTELYKNVRTWQENHCADESLYHQFQHRVYNHFKPLTLHAPYHMYIWVEVIIPEKE